MLLCHTQSEGRMMKFKLIATAALVTFAAVGSASAADLGAPAPNYYKAPPPPPPVSTFTGCYIAGGGGYGFWTQDSFTRTPAGVQITNNNTNGGKGWFGMGQAGCDYEFNSPLPLFGWSPRLVIGAFGDWDGGQIDGTWSGGSGTGVIGAGNERLSSAWFAGGRLGYVVNPRFMTYVDGGWTQARFNQADLSGLGGVVPPVALGVSLAANTYNGWFIGSGFEYSLDILPINGLFLKTEFRYSQYGGNSGTGVPLIATATGVPTGFTVNSQKAVEMVSTELVWRFNFFR
jgi:outer membrane immunogenic protein